MECNFQQLFFCNDGYIVKCITCGTYSVAFGNSLFTLSAVQFKRFSQRLNSVFLTKPVGIRGVERKHIITVTAAMSLVLSESELNVLHDIFVQANAILEVEHFLETQS